MDLRPDLLAKTYRLIAVDIDGTLVNSRSELTPRTRQAIGDAVNAGVIFVISTGRPMRGVEHLNALLPVDLPFITYNGAVVIMGKSKKRLLERTLAPGLCLEAIELGLERKAGVVAWVNDELYIFENSEKNDIYRKISKFEPVFAENISTLVQNGADKVLWCDSADRIGELQAEMWEHFAGRLNCHTSNPKLLEFVDTDASKAKAMEKIGELYGIGRDEMIAVGDGYNDLSMIEYAGLGVAMGNAVQAVKETAGFVTLSNDEDGVAHVIDRFILHI